MTMMMIMVTMVMMVMVMMVMVMMQFVHDVDVRAFDRKKDR